MKINIIYNYTDAPIGGTNQFLKALKNYFIEQNVYTENEEVADAFLFIAYKNPLKVINLKHKYPNKLFIHRIDGPVRMYSKMSDKRDFITNTINNYIADATIFQTNWSKFNNFKLGLKNNRFETTIINAPDNKIFNKINKHNFIRKNKIKLIATSWSPNMNKGFEIYKYLDKHLDFSKYEMTFCGNSPIIFKNIKIIKPLPSKELAELLKKHDIYITASQKDPCSNSLIEAIHCGLPAIALNDGGHPEIIQKNGEIFNKKEEIDKLLYKIVNNYKNYTNNELPLINEVGHKYYNFIYNIYQMQQQKKYSTKKLVFWQIIIIYYQVFRRKISLHLKRLIKRK
ncbi:MAG: glycosyltransferase [Bacteroidales bacterium]|nr:glycosyltransferase [Bacteroidales bacterium]